MPRFMFNWTISGSTTIEAETLQQAKEIWNKDSQELTLDEIVLEADDVDFSDDEVLVEVEPGVFEEEKEESEESEDEDEDEYEPHRPGLDAAHAIRSGE